MPTLIARPHPLRSDTYRVDLPAGTTIKALIGDIEGVHAQVNGEVWPRERWNEALPDGLVNVYATTPEGDDGLRIAAVIAIAVASYYTAGLASGWASAAGFGANAAGAIGAGVSAAVTVAGSLAVNALIPPKMPDTPSASTSTIRQSVTGTRNQANPYGVVPRVYGNPRWYPPLAANPVTEIGGSDQYLRMLVCLGYGPLEVAGHRVGVGHPRLANADVGDAIRIGETPIGQYDGVTWEIGTPDQLTLFTQTIAEEGVSAALDLQDRYTGGGLLESYDNVSAVRTTAPETTEISIDITWPSGLYTLDSKGDTFHANVDWTIEYAPAGSGDWTKLPGNSPELWEWERVRYYDEDQQRWRYKSQRVLKEQAGLYIRVRSKSKTTLRKNWRWNVPEGQYDVRVTRVRTTSNNREGIVTDATWNALRSIQGGKGAPYKLDHVVMALRIKATDQLNGIVDQLSLKTQSVLRVWDGEAFSEQATSNPAWAYLDAFTGAQVGRPIADNRIDLDALLDWAEWCDDQGLQYHWVHDSPETMLERARVIAAGGQASFALQDGLFGVVRDDADAPVLQVISPRNASGFESTRQYKALPHALRVKYIDPETWSDSERIVYRDGFSEINATVFEDFETQGVASEDEAWHHGQYYLRQAILRPETFTAQMDWEHLAVVRGNRVRMAYDTIMVGLSWGRIKSISADSITLDERVIYDPAVEYGIRVRCQDGEQVTTQVTHSVAGETATLTLVEPIPNASIGDLVLFGELGKESIDCKITRIEPGGDFTANLTLVDAATNIYDFGTAPQYDPGITLPTPITELKPTAPAIDALYSDGTTLVMRQDGLFAPGVAASWSLPSGGIAVDQVEVRFSSDNGGTWDRHQLPSAQRFIRVEAQVSGLRVAAQMRARSIYGTWGDWGGMAYITTVGREGRPRDVTGFTLAAVSDHAQLSWDPALDLDVLHGGHVQIYHAPRLDATIAGAVPLARFAGTATEATVPLMYGTYFAVFEDAGLRASIAPARITTTAPRINKLNVVETLTEGPGFEGDAVGAVAIDDILKLDSALTIDEMLDPIDDWGNIDSHGGLSESGEYIPAETVDLGGIFTSRLTASIATRTYLADDTIDNRSAIDDWVDVDGVTDFAGPLARLFIRHTNDDPDAAPIWSEWEAFTLGDYTARAYQFKLQLTTDNPDHQIEVTEYSVTIDMPDRVEGDNDIVIPAEGLTITFAAPFWTKPAVGVTAEDLATGDRARITNKSVEGFTVQILDASDNGVERTLDWIAKGYGYREAA